MARGIQLVESAIRMADYRLISVMNSWRVAVVLNDPNTTEVVITGVFDAAHHHAQMVTLHHHADPFRLLRHNRLGDLLCQAFLYLKTARKQSTMRAIC